ncbi:PREDICTED: uncharacterized protein LOC109146658 [Ipomoea nil]|uniref:uncharacterized protein LOC109146658 n=1 Tax=Ipomoea nil TaxID=35883 RepID=UPI0009019CE0|nr:PREDICTED: uncharacterized protein LOC109146658 [Ipomoea nil]
MSTVSWNCRGLGSPRTVRELLGLVSKKRPMFVFLMETKAKNDRVESVRTRMGYEGNFCVERDEDGEGLALLWRDKEVATLLGYSSNHIDVSVSLPGKPCWRLTCFYGYSQSTRRQESWDLLRHLKGQSNLPWCVIGDFNDLACQSEKRGPHIHPESLIQGFTTALEDCQLQDLGMIGNRYTWDRGRGTDAWVEERLDRGLATADWSDIYDEALIFNIITMSSDHNALYMDVEGLPSQTGRNRFRFESAWLLDDSCRVVVERSWALSLGLNFQKRVNDCGQCLKRWGGAHYVQFGRQINFLRSKLALLRDNRTPQAVAEYLLIEKDLSRLLTQEELYWRQRSKQLWLKEGDSNTKFFHKFATARKRANRLARITNSSGEWLEGSALNEEILRYYTHIFHSEATSVNFFQHVQRRVTGDMNASLLRPFTHEEVKLALFDMAPDKAPGPDGMTPSFYQRFWPVVGHDLTSFVLSCLNRKNIPERLNDTTIVLIPKKKVPEKVGDLRPIALCNVAYKVIAKVLANRLKEVLEEVISPAQSAFIKDRLLSDNIIMAGEIGHYLRRHRQGAVGWSALKLDMAKAYDRMEWSFLEGMFGALGFDPAWTELIMMCVSTINYNITVNDESVGVVTPSRGIRQGDPLSPYLFIICAEGLSTLFSRAEARGDIHGLKIARGAPPVSHLLFADDCLLFFKACTQEMQAVKNVLDLYCAASGQQINFDKSSLMFSASTSPTMRIDIANSLGVRLTDDLGKYLGLLSLLGRNKVATFRFIEHKIRDRMASWRTKFISRAGKEILLKSIAQSLPIFAMSVYLLPLTVCDRLERLMNRYWWENGGSNNRGIPWLSWTRLCAPKDRGGMGFKKLHEFNLALLAKQGWRLIVCPTSIVGRALKAKYFPSSDFLDATLGNNPSYIWRSILAGIPVLRAGMVKRIGDGKDTTIWGAPWLADKVNPKLLTPIVEELKYAPGTWDLEVVHDLFDQADVPRIIATPVSPDYKDEWFWKDDIHGRYSVRQGYRYLMQSSTHGNQQMQFTEWRNLWKLPVPPKIRNFLWRCMRDVLPLRENLRAKHVWVGEAALFVFMTMKHLIICSLIVQ